MHGSKRQKIAGEGDGSEDVTPTVPSAPPPPPVTPNSDTPLGSSAPESPPIQGIQTNEEDLETFIANPILTEDKILRSLEATWCIPGGLTHLRQMKANISAAFVNGCHRTVLHSPPFGFDQEVMVDMFRKAKPTFLIKLLALHQHRGQNYVALFLERVDQNPGRSWPFFKAPIICSFELEITNSEGVTICKRESSSGQFAEGDSKGWSLFATHPQILDNNPGNDVLINCKIKAVSSKPFTILHSPFPSPTSSSTFTFRSESAPPAPAPLAAAASSDPPTPTPSESDISDPFATFLKNSDTDITTTAMDVDVDGESSATATTTTPDSHPNVRIAVAIKMLKKRFEGYKIPNVQLKIKCKDQEITANFLPLAARSEHFLNLWFKDEGRFLSNGPVIRMDDEDPRMVRCVIDYLCNDSCSILEGGNLVDMLDLLTCPLAHSIDDLVHDLMEQILESLEPDTILLVVAKFTVLGLLQDKTLDTYKILEDYVIKNRKELRKAPQFLADPNGCRQLLLQFLV